MEEISEVLLKIQRGNLRPVRYIPKTTFEEAWDVFCKVGASIVPGFRVDEYNRTTYEEVVKWCICDRTARSFTPDGKKLIPADLRKGLYIQGPIGTGKSVLLDILKDTLSTLRIGVRYSGDDTPKALWWRTYRADDLCDEFLKEGTLWEQKRCASLCIQDLGTEPQEVVYMGTRVRPLRSLLEARGDNRSVLTFVSSNIPLIRTGEYYGERVQSRLFQMCNVYQLAGKDRRYL